jgi:hypothetical protein
MSRSLLRGLQRLFAASPLRAAGDHGRARLAGWRARTRTRSTTCWRRRCRRRRGDATGRRRRTRPASCPRHADGGAERLLYLHFTADLRCFRTRSRKRDRGCVGATKWSKGPWEATLTGHRPSLISRQQSSAVLPKWQPRCGLGRRVCSFGLVMAVRGGEPLGPVLIHKGESREADLSTEQAGAQAPSRLPDPNGHHGRPQGTQCPAGARPQAAQCVTGRRAGFPMSVQ